MLTKSSLKSFFVVVAPNIQEVHQSGTDGGLEGSGVYSLTATHHTHFMLVPSVWLLITSMAPSTHAGSDHRPSAAPAKGPDQ